MMCHFRLMFIMVTLLAMGVGVFGIHDYITMGGKIIHEPFVLILYILLFAIGFFGFIWGVFENQINRLFTPPDKWF